MAPDAKPLVLARGRCRSDPWFEQLWAAVTARPGYDKFCQAKGVKLQNVEIVESWHFATDVKCQYYGKTCLMLSVCGGFAGMRRLTSCPGQEDPKGLHPGRSRGRGDLDEGS